ncbi:dihydroneopterin aldolase [Kovacikia minuta CCNUW1]|uniref:dihydroneopterin aldolase n=1 Tax=Kovacikia minuta TaxID=2931930 RepID=UPI001CCD75E3|nr:dihydroneopterin aldolase [Kovacikia minuta]UBF26621.1 dihydroneopterin aldolase [Kovacikia minuta CCNUW1]
MDSIYLSGIRGYGYTGVLPEEQVLGQWFEVDLTLWLDLSIAGESDRLEDTLDYRGVIETVQSIIKKSKFALLERLATAIAQAILHPESPGALPIHQVRVCLTKPAAPIPDFGGKITIELTRGR